MYNLKTATLKDISMRYFHFGSGEKTLVILPGLSVKSVLDSAAAIARQYSVFQTDFTVYVFERRDNPPAHYPVRQMAEDTAAVLCSLELKDICLFGASQGGMLAMEIALEHPALVKKLALGSTCARVGDTELCIISHWAQLARDGEREALFADFCRKVYPTPFYERFQEFFVRLSHDVSDEELARFSVLCDGTAGFDVLESLPRLCIPVLVLASEDDAVIGTAAREAMCAALKETPAFEQFLYTDCGHAAYDTAADYQTRLFDYFSRD